MAAPAIVSLISPEASTTPPAEPLQEIALVRETAGMTEIELLQTFITALRDLGERSVEGYNASFRSTRERITSIAMDSTCRLVEDAMKNGARAKRWIDLSKSRVGYIDAKTTTRVSEILVQRQPL